ncbi:MAG: beta-ketoacyl synthase chain length factor [Burkholderiales bacterium]|nr:beta-ketoacyl synthase chain length factor [Burkholderiales bacterium]
MIGVHLCGIGVAAPGLAGWDALRALLAGGVRYNPRPLEHAMPDALPPAERRRAGQVVRLAIAVAQEAAAHAGVDAGALASVFASADGDGENLHHICSSLAGAAPEVSPTRFHNSVQNATGGYWSIAVRSQAPSNAVIGLDGAFAAGLLEAATQAAIEQRDMLLVAYDLPMPAPLYALHPIDCGAGLALVLRPQPRGASLARLTLGLAPGADETTAVTAMRAPELEALRCANPTLRALALLAPIARREDATVLLPLDGGDALRVRVDAAR